MPNKKNYQTKSNNAHTQPGSFSSHSESQQPYGWNASQKRIATDNKRTMAECFVCHEFLVRHGENPEDSRRTDASILVNPGTTPFTVVQAALKWLNKNWKEHGPFNIMWYSPSLMVASFLYQFKNEHPYQRSAAEQILFPGYVDHDIACVLGEQAIRFARDFQRRMTYSFLSAHRLSLENGKVYFHFETEVELQRAYACIYAGHKFLFVDPTKLRSIDGVPSYQLHDLIATADAVTIYTISSNRNQYVCELFERLCDKYFLSSIGKDSETDPSRKIFRLCIINTAGEYGICQEHKGQLKALE